MTFRAQVTTPRAVGSLFTEEIKEGLEPWATDMLRPFREEYLMGVPALRPEPFPKLWVKNFNDLVLPGLRRRFLEKYPGGSHIMMMSHRKMHDRQVMLLLLPVFIFTLRKADRFSNVYINGFSGETMFRMPPQKRFRNIRIVPLSVIAFGVLFLVVLVKIVLLFIEKM